MTDSLQERKLTLYLVVVFVVVFVALGQLEEHRQMRVFGHSVPARVDLQSPFDPVYHLGI